MNHATDEEGHYQDFSLRTYQAHTAAIDNHGYIQSETTEEFDTKLDALIAEHEQSGEDPFN